MQFQPATELIKEIAVLELEVVYLEQHLLSLYRKAFDQQLSSVNPSTKEESVKPPLTTPRARFIEVANPEVLTERGGSTVQSNDHKLETLPKEHYGYEHETLGKEYNGSRPEEKHLDSAVYRCHSSLSQCSAFTTASPPAEPFTKSLRACHSQPLSMMEVNLISWKNSYMWFSSLHIQLLQCNHNILLIEESILVTQTLPFFEENMTIYCQILSCDHVYLSLQLYQH